MQNPALLSESRLNAVVKAYPWLDREGEGKKAIELCRAMLADFSKGDQPFPVGPGPLERLLARQLGGELSPEAAAREAAALSWQLSPIYVRGLSQQGENWGQHGQWRKAVGLHRLLLAALDAATPVDAEAKAMQDEATYSWIEIVTRALNDVPDGRLYRDALKRGEAVAAQAQAAGDLRLRSGILHRLGVMHLDPYVSGRTSAGLEGQLRRWQQRLETEFGVTTQVMGEDLLLPAPLIAFRKAEEYLGAAAEPWSGRIRAPSLKAMAQAISWRECLGDTIDSERLRQVCEEALGHLDQKNDLESISVLRSLLLSNEAAAIEGDTANPPAASDDLKKQALEIANRVLDPVDGDAEFAALKNPVNTQVMLLTQADILASTDLHTAVRLWQAALILVIAGKLEEEFIASVYRNGITILARGFGRYRALLAVEDASAFIGNIRSLESEREKDGLTTIGMLALAAAEEKEELALVALQELGAKGFALFPAARPVMPYLHMVLLTGAAVNALKKGDKIRTSIGYLEAAKVASAIPLHRMVEDLLLRAEDVIANTEAERVGDVIPYLATSALDVERATGKSAAAAIAQICRTIVTRMLSAESANATELFFVMQIGKGLRFNAMLASDHDYFPGQDAAAQKLLGRIEEVGQSLGEKPRREPGILDDAILCSLIQDETPEADSDPAAVLANLMHRFDAYVSGALLVNAELGMDQLKTPEDIQAAIDERTVVIVCYPTNLLDGRLVLCLLLISKDMVQGVTLIAADQALAGPIGLTVDGRDLLTDHLGVGTIATRRAIVVDPPAGRPITYQGQKFLDSFGGAVVGPFFQQVLSELRRSGRDHLCIVPHGALHFFPLHLVSIGGRLIADDWTVTYLPAIRLLFRPKSTPARRPIATFGVSFAGGDATHAVLEDASAEAAAIASLFACEPNIDDRVTAEAVSSALRECRMVHLATHGHHPVDAPMFQCLYLYPGASQDRLRAYEVLDHSLPSLDMVTLSACETALGRFDASDNLRGLPAACFIAGANTIVGTLWPVETTASSRFFTSFYRALAGGAEKREAFRAAQLETRLHHPEYRDWGAFCMAGSWH